MGDSVQRGGGKTTGWLGEERRKMRDVKRDVGRRHTKKG